MIVVKLKGGLGNQLFQYATARRLAVKNQVELKLDIVTGFNIPGVYSPRHYELHHFAISEIFATWWEIKLATNKIKENHYHFDPTVLNLSDDCYLEGSWQSEKYFLDITGILQKELVPRNDLSERTKKLIREVSRQNSVAVHIRRDDYVTNQYSHQKHGVCDLNYYLNAQKIMMSKVKNPQFYFFSDDMPWVKANFPNDRLSHYVTRDKNDFEDFWLMSHCRNFIIANSSFSWWVAWLGQDKRKIVIAPKTWLLDKTYNTKDLLPENWLKI